MDWTPSGATRLVLIRHGETAEACRGRCYGRLDVGLSPRGRVEAARTAAWLAPAPLTAIYASPLSRAVDSARPIAESHGLALQLDDALCELDFGALEGLTWDEAAARHPEVYAAWMSHPTTVRFPGGESWAMLRARVLDRVRLFVAPRENETIAIVAHGGVLRAILADALRVADEDIFRLDQSHSAVSVIDYFRDTAVVRLLNRVS